MCVCALTHDLLWQEETRVARTDSETVIYEVWMRARLTIQKAINIIYFTTEGKLDLVHSPVSL